MRSTTRGRLAIVRRARRPGGVWFEAVGSGHRVCVDVPAADDFFHELAAGQRVERVMQKQLAALSQIQTLLMRAYDGGDSLKVRGEF